MTGSARCEADTPAGLLACEIRTVNHRHLDLSLRMPEECRVLEAALRERVSAAVSRGKVELALYLRRRPAAWSRPFLSKTTWCCKPITSARSASAF
jgi:uncharacterized protein (TIGR00255 family)